MSKPYEGKNGIFRDIAKLKYQWQELQKHPEWKIAVARWKKKPWSTHEQTNLWTEASRYYPYLTAHAAIVSLYAVTIFAVSGWLL